MALSIKNEELDQRIRRLTELTGQGITTSLRIAVDNEISRREGTKKKDYQKFLAEVREIQKRVATYPKNDLTEDEILGYDEFGMPTQ